MIIPPNEEGTRSGALAVLYDHVRDFAARDGVVDCSFCCANAWLDAPEQGWTALAVTDGDDALALSDLVEHGQRELLAVIQRTEPQGLVLGQ